MESQPLRIEWDDGETVNVYARQGDLIRVERHFGKSMASLGVSNEVLACLCWKALGRMQHPRWVTDFDEFIDATTCSIPVDDEVPVEGKGLGLAPPTG
jgi:hypothetical protein